jgi:hypothetical protein
MARRALGETVVVITRAALALAMVGGIGGIGRVPPVRAAEILEESDLPEQGPASRDDDWDASDVDRDRDEDRDFTAPDRSVGERDAAEPEPGADPGGPGARVEDSLERAGEGTHRALEHGAEPVGGGLERAMRATGRGLRAAIDGTGEFLRRAGNALTGRDDE